MRICISEFKHSHFTGSKSQRISIFYIIRKRIESKFFEKWFSYNFAAKSSDHFSSRNIPAVSKRFFERQHSFEFVISVIRLISSNLEWDIKDGGINCQRKFFQCQCIDQRLDGRTGLSRSSHHIILSFDGFIEVIDRTYIRQHIAILSVEIYHRAIVSSIILKNGIVCKNSFFGYLLDIAIKRCFDDESSLGQRTGSICFFKFFDNPLNEMRRFDKESIFAELNSDTLDDSVFEFFFGDMSVFIHPIQSQIFSSIYIFHIKSIS